MNNQRYKKILLSHLPFWTPLVPPQGIVYLKSALEKNGYIAKTIDANIENVFKQYYDQYFNLFRKTIPLYNRSNLYNLGHNVLRDHMMAHINFTDEGKYLDLLDKIIFNVFYCNVSRKYLLEFKSILDNFFLELKKYYLNIFYEFEPEVIGISVMRDTIASSLFVAKLIKEEYPDVMTIMGGSIFSDHLLIDTPNFEYFVEKTSFIDYYLIGPGEGLIVKLLNGEFPKDRKIFTLKDITQGEIEKSQVFVPDMSDLNVEQNYTYLSAQGSSSCLYQCSFCNVVAFYGPYKQKPCSQTVKEMSDLYHKYGRQMFFMNDSLLNPILTDLSYEIIDQKLPVYFDGYLKVDDQSGVVENTLLWRQGGYYRARIGIESGSQKILNLMNKKTTIEQSKKTLKALAEAGIKTTAYIVIGHPGETEEDFQLTLDYISEMKDYIWEAECNPFIFAYSGQSNSDEWSKKRKRLYPSDAKEMLIIEYWTIDCEPQRSVTYDRASRFVKHCNKLDVPNPYSLYEIQSADERWARLHKNAVPFLIDFQNSSKVIENKKFKKIHTLKMDISDLGDFNF